MMDGSLVAWGAELVGPDPLPGGNDFTAITAGGGFNIALKDDGSLVGWGTNYFGQTDVPSGNGFLAIAAGGNHVLAIVPEPRSVAGLVTMAGAWLLLAWARRRGKRASNCGRGGD